MRDDRLLSDLVLIREVQLASATMEARLASQEAVRREAVAASARRDGEEALAFWQDLVASPGALGSELPGLAGALVNRSVIETERTGEAARIAADAAGMASSERAAAKARRDVSADILADAQRRFRNRAAEALLADLADVQLFRRRT